LLHTNTTVKPLSHSRLETNVTKHLKSNSLKMEVICHLRAKNRLVFTI